MKAAVRSRYGGPDVVRVEDVGTPALTDDELLVEVRATTVNRTDCGVRAAKPFLYRLFTGLVRPRLRILGNEFAGQVHAVGRNVTTFRVGDRVFGYNDRSFGAHAQYMSMPRDGTLAVIPAGLSYDAAAPSTEGSHYALSMIRVARIGAGQDVLVYGASGAIGSAAVQLVKNLGAVVTAVCDTRHVNLVGDLGADRVVDYTAQDFTADERRYDAVLDAVGKSTFGRCRLLLKPGGVYVSSDLGPWAQNLFLPLVTRLARGKRVRFPFPRHDAAMAQHLGELIESGAFTPVIDRRYSLDEITEAYRYVETGQKTGNVVITVELTDH
jgi:NADPH:quinone reductase-like Zn-dependent oxidoreductase